MAVQFSAAVRNAAAATIEATIGASPTLEIRTGAPPATTATADSGSVLATIPLPADWLGAASGGSVALAGSWTVAVAGTGTAGHFRIKQGATTHAQGTVSQRTEDGGTGDLRLAQATAGLVAGQTVTVQTFTFTIGGA
jgi:hypothetical protein